MMKRATLLSLAVSALLGGGALPARADGLDEDYRYAVALMGERGEYAAAAEKFREILAAAPGAPRAPQALYCLANCCLKQGQEAAAAECYAQLVRDFPNDPLAAEAAACGADACFRAGRMEQAVALYGVLLDKFPQTPAGRAAAYWRAECHLRLAAAANDEAAAAEHYRAALADFRAFASAPHAMLPAALLGAGLAAFDHRDYAAAREFLGRFVREFPASERRDDGLFHLAESAYWQNDLEAAAESYARLRQEFPAGRYAAGALAGLGWCAYGRGDKARAGKLFSEAAALRDDPVAAAADHYDAGAALAEAGDLTAAAKEFAATAAVAGSPRALAATLRLGALARADKGEGAAARAEGHFAAALELAVKQSAPDAVNDAANANPEAAATTAALGAEAAAQLGELRLARGDAAGAAAAWRAGWEKWPQSRYAAFSAYHLALAEARAQNHAAAVEALRGLLRACPRSRFRLGAAYLMADCQLALGATEKARAAWKWLADEGRQWAAARAAEAPDAANADANVDAGAPGAAALKRQAEDLAARALFRLGESHAAAVQASTAEAEKTAEKEAAVAAFSRLVKDFPASPLAAMAHLRLGEAAEKQGDAAAAAAAYAAAVKDAASMNGAGGAGAADGESAASAERPGMAGVRMHAAYRQAALAAMRAPASGEGRVKAMREAKPQLQAFIKEFAADPAAAALLPRAQYYLAEAEYALGDRAAAAAAYAASHRAAPQDALADAALFGMAWCAREDGDLPAAAAHCRALLDGYPKSACRDGAHAIVCAAAAAAGKHDEELDLARRWKEECPASAARATMAEAQALDALGRPGEAEKLLAGYLAPAAENAPEAAERPRALQLLGLACWHQAEPLFAKADAAAVKLRDFLGGKKLRELDGAKREQAAALRRDWLDALSAAREVENRMVAALSCAVDDYSELPGRAANLLRLGEAAYDRGRLDDAAKRYRAALAADGAAVADKAHYRLGWCALRQSEKAEGAEKARLREEAGREFAGVAKDCPQSPLAGESAWQAAEIRRAARDFAGARPLYEQAREKGRTAEIRDGAACAAATCLLEMKQYREAYDAFKAFAAAAKTEAAKAWLPEANWGAGFAALKLGAYDEAREFFLAAKAGDYNGEAAAKARYGLGMIEFEQGHWKGAREEFRKVELFHAAWPEVAALALVKAAAASQELGEAESAARDLQRVIDKYAGAAAVAQARELLGKMPAGR